MSRALRATSLRKRLTGAMTALVLAAMIAATLGFTLTLLLPSVQGLGSGRVDEAATRVSVHLHRLLAQTDRLLNVTADWLRQGQVSMDHRSLNRQFIPLLSRYPEYSALLVADNKGREWMLFQRPDGVWINRLSSPQDSAGTRRFLQWKDADTLLKEERLKSDYEPRKRPWFRNAEQAAEGTIVWTEIYRFFTTDEPGVTASQRVNTGEDDLELYLGLDLRLLDLARYVSRIEIPDQGLALLLTREGRVLGLPNLPRFADDERLEQTLLKPLLGLELGPLATATDLWLSRGDQPIRDTTVWHDWQPWYGGFRRLDLGDEHLWLGVYLPYAGLIPGLGYQLALLVAVLILTLAAGLATARRLARRLSQPLERLATGALRIGALDFTPEPLAETGVRDLDQLGSAQNQMRSMLQQSHEALTRKNQELEAAQARLIQAAKLESVGRLAAGVAHEVKNPLAIVQMGVDFLRGEPGLPETAAGVLGDMDDAVARADRVIKGLLDFSREHRMNLAPGDLNEVIRSSLRLVEHELRQRNIAIDLHLEERLPPVRLDRARLQQVFINLLMNAAQAMEKDGTLHLTSCRRPLGRHSGLDRDTTGRFREGETALWVEVADTGPGVPEDTLARIFDPFFTTKAVGQGTGLGLSVSRSIVELHGGGIDIRNAPGGGASAVLLFKLEDIKDEEEDPGGG